MQRQICWVSMLSSLFNDSRLKYIINMLIAGDSTTDDRFLHRRRQSFRRAHRSAALIRLDWCLSSSSVSPLHREPSEPNRIWPTSQRTCRWRRLEAPQPKKAAISTSISTTTPTLVEPASCQPKVSLDLVFIGHDGRCSCSSRRRSARHCSGESSRRPAHDDVVVVVAAACRATCCSTCRGCWPADQEEDHLYEAGHLPEILCRPEEEVIADGRRRLLPLAHPSTRSLRPRGRRIKTAS